MLVSIFFVLRMTSDDAPGGRAVLSVLLINSFLFVSVLTVLCSGAVILIFVLRSATVLNFEIAYSSGLSRLAVCVGTGAAIGTFAATLTPVVSAFLSGLGDDPTEVAFVALDPSSLVELPAVAAVIGYAYGVMSAVFKLFEKCFNLLFRRFVPLVCILVAVYLSSLVELTPKGVVALNLERIGAQASGLNHSCGGLLSGLEEAGQVSNAVEILLAGEVCGESIVMGDQVFYSFVIGVCTLYAVASFIKDYCAHEVVQAGMVE